MLSNFSKLLSVATIGVFLLIFSYSSTNAQPLVLQEMGWIDVQNYLKTNDMVIIPLGSTEQHGPHMPLGSDYFEAFAMSKKISERTGVVIAPVVMAGYSVYHSGFPGTLSLKPETLEQVLFETSQMLIKYGFKKIMFFNYHGGNNVVQNKVIHRINHTTEAVAVAIGHGSAIQKSDDDEEFFDWHAGKNETSIMLYLKPELVKMERYEKPVIRFNPKVEKLYQLSKKYPELKIVAGSMLGVPVETKKGGASHEISSNGIWSYSDVRTASKKIGEKSVIKMVDAAVDFIEAWQEAEK